MTDTNQSVSIQGVSITRVTAHNAGYIRDHKIGPGSIIKITRAGDVIPYIEAVVKGIKAQMPPGKEGVDWNWDDTQVNILSTHDDHPDKKRDALVFAFRQLAIDDVGDANCSILVEAGLDTLPKVIQAGTPKLVELLGKALGKKIVAEIHVALDRSSLNNLMVASGCFGFGFGESRAEKLLDSFPEYCTLKPKDAAKLSPPHGFSAATMKKISKGLKAFKAYVKALGMSEKRLVKVKKTIKLDSQKYAGRVFCFTGVRDQELTDYLVRNGATVSNSFTRATNILICRDKGSGSSKMNKAREMDIEIYDIHSARKKFLKV